MSNSIMHNKTQMLMGSRKSHSFAKHFNVLFKYIDQNRSITKDLFDSLLEYSVVLYLKSNGAV